MTGEKFHLSYVIFDQLFLTCHFGFKNYGNFKMQSLTGNFFRIRELSPAI